MELAVIHGCFAGLALGDALGMPTEFLTPEQIQTAFGWVDQLVKAPDWHPHAIMTAGQVTDDTGQALAVLHACLADGQVTAETVARHLVAWEDSTPKEVLAVVEGPSTRAALKRIRQGENIRKTGSAGKTNGAAMRMAAVGLLTSGDLQATAQAALEASYPTHSTCIALSGATAVAWAVAAASQGATVAETLEAGRWGAVEGSRHGAWVWSTALEDRILLAEKVVRQSTNQAEALRDLYRFVGVDMLVPESVAAAFGVVLLAQGDPMRAVVLGANIGGDTDTIAAIAGQICGAMQGISAFDLEMVHRVEEVNGLDLEKEAQLLQEAILRGQGSS